MLKRGARAIFTFTCIASPQWIQTLVRRRIADTSPASRRVASRRVARCCAVLYRIARRMRFMLIHYIKQLTVYQEPALFLVMSRYFMRRLSICETAPSSLAHLILARLSCVLRNHNFVAVLIRNLVRTAPSHVARVEATRAFRCIMMKRLRSSDNASRKIV